MTRRPALPTVTGHLLRRKILVGEDRFGASDEKEAFAATQRLRDRDPLRYPRQISDFTHVGILPI